MLVTPRQRFPYPQDKEAAAGALHIQMLAEAVDAELDGLDISWPAQLQRPSALISLVTTQTGIPATTDFGFSLDTEIYDNAALTTGQFITGRVPGWYHVWGTVSLNATGTANNGTLRRLMLRVYDSSNPAGSVLTEELIHDEFETNSFPQGNTVAGPVYLDAQKTVNMYVRHGNTSSTMQVQSPTYLAATYIGPRT